jgi:hypothetical protein
MDKIKEANTWNGMDHKEYNNKTRKRPEENIE